MDYLYLIFSNVLSFLSINILPGVSFLWFLIALIVFLLILRFI